MTKLDFTYSDEKEPHVLRAKSILKTHPEVKQLMGRNPYTLLIILAAVSIQLTLAWFLSGYSWIWVIATAWLLGAFIAHTLFVTIHEATHNLLFKQRSLNIMSAIIANIPSLLPTAVSFIRYHVKHHSFQGTPEFDADLPSRWEAKLIGASPIGKALWLLYFPLFQIFRTLRIQEVKVFDKWLVINWVIQFCATTAIYIFLGPKAMVYLFLSFFFSLGLHPLGARWVQEHFLTSANNPTQETFSYYGIMNIPNLNVGYHNEHHDFPAVPWNNLRKLKNTANEYYQDLSYHTSYSRLFLRFLFDRNITLFSRMIRFSKKRTTEKNHQPVSVIN